MPTYQVRFLRPDDSYAKAALEQDFASDADVCDYVRSHHGQKALEVWEGERLVTRRVSAAHDARLRGWYRRSCRYPAIQDGALDELERRYGPMPYPEFERLGLTSQLIFEAFKAAMAEHPVWIRANGHPAAPPTIASVRVSFHPTRRDDDQWIGWTTASVFSSSRDEEAIVEDVMRAAQAAMMTAHLHCPNVATAAADRQRPVLRHGVTISGHFDVDWAINHLPT